MRGGLAVANELIGCGLLRGVTAKGPRTWIRDQLGHSSLAVTGRYLRNVAPADLIALGSHAPGRLTSNARPHGTFNAMFSADC